MCDRSTPVHENALWHQKSIYHMCNCAIRNNPKHRRFFKVALTRRLSICMHTRLLSLDACASICAFVCRSVLSLDACRSRHDIDKHMPLAGRLSIQTHFALFFVETIVCHVRRCKLLRSHWFYSAKTTWSPLAGRPPSPLSVRV